MYNGYLIKIGSTPTPNVEIPFKFMKYDSFQTTYETLDLDSYRDANGVLHRNALAHRCAKVEFETPIMYKHQMDELMALIRSNYENAQEQSLYVKVYLQEIDDYVTQKCYLVNTTFKFEQNSPVGFIYQPTRICFIAY